MAQQEMPGFVRVAHQWTGEERWNALRCRLGRFGASSRVAPGLYALGQPDADSPAVATSSYRLTFDQLRRGLAGISCWVLVLDTRGLDVASAAAGGQLGTDEVVSRLISSRLERVVSHWRIVLPGLASDAVDASEVAARTGFECVPGPSAAADLPAFLNRRAWAQGAAGAAGAQRPPEARPAFTVVDALALVASEIGRSLMYYPGFAFAAILYTGLGPGGVTLGRAIGGSWPLLALGLAAVAAGSGLAPLVHAAVRAIPLWAAGEIAGLGAAAALLQGARLSAGMDLFLRLGCWLFFPTASAVLAARFSRSLPAAAAARQKTAPVLIALAVLLAAGAAAALALSKAALLRGSG